MSQDELNKHRMNIDALDAEILLSLNKRAEHARAIGILKNSKIAYRPEREMQVLERMRSLNHGPLSNETVIYLFREIMSACLALQRPLKIAFLGPLGTFSQAATTKHFGHAAKLAPCASIPETFRAVEIGNADYAVVPADNSIEGIVSTTLDLLTETQLHIFGEVKLRIEQHLLRKTSGLDNIQKIYSHAQSLAQCKIWLQQNLPHAELISVTSNSKAVQLALEDNNSAAIAGEIAAKQYALQIIQQHIANHANNITRFLVLGNHMASPSGKDKTSIVIGTQNKPGSICTLLAPLAKKQINILSLNSRPSPLDILEYLFFIDLEGHQNEPHISEVLTELKNEAAFIKILGSYPIAAF